MGRSRFQRIERDALTGEALTPNGSRFVVQREIAGREIPTTLHKHKTMGDGAFEWTHDFMAVLGELVPSSVHDEWRTWREWWHDEYIVSRLTARFGSRQTQHVIAFVTGGKMTCSRGKAERARRQMMRAIRSRDGLNPNHDRPFAGRDLYRLD